MPSWLFPWCAAEPDLDVEHLQQQLATAKATIEAQRGEIDRLRAVLVGVEGVVDRFHEGACHERI
jgi:hypothetical protein